MPLWHGLVALLLLACTHVAHAIPVYARQTGAACADCHAGAYGGGGNGPNLTPYGMRFKLNGYTDTDGNGFKIPVAAQLTEIHTAPARSPSSTNLTEADLYIAGRLTDQIGGYIKVEADHVGHDTYNTKLSNIDLRFVAKELKLGGKDFTLGVSVNNSPGFDDPITVLPSATRGVPGGQGPTGTFLNPGRPNGPVDRVIGATVYGLYDSSWYGEVGTYNSLPTSTQDHLGYSISGDPGKISDTGYFRFAYMKDLKRQFFSVGIVGLTTRQQLQRIGPANDLTDLGYDLTYQFLGNRENIVQLSYVNIMEKRKYGSTFASPTVPGLLALPRGVLHDQALSVTYTFKQTYGVQIAHTSGTGTRDAVRFGPYGTPDTTVNLISVFWAPFGKDDSFTSVANLKIAATWFRYTKFNGATNNIFDVPPGVLTTKPGNLNAFTVSASVAF
ncbi:MAG TPA: cytochrome C [Rhodanobacter sp.]